MEKKEVGVKRSIELKDAIKYLHDLADSLKKGEVYVQQGNEYLALKPKPTVFLEAKAKRKKDKEKFSFSIGWYNETLVEEGDDIKISADKPKGDVKEIEETEEDE